MFNSDTSRDNTRHRTVELFVFARHINITHQAHLHTEMYLLGRSRKNRAQDQMCQDGSTWADASQL